MIGEFVGVFWFIIKLLTVLGLAIYVVFSLVIVRQERLMSAVIEEGFEPVIKSLVLIHLFASLAIFVLAIVLL